jgi:type IV secretory pathway TraG/TraD family ATPase VirD4
MITQEDDLAARHEGIEAQAQFRKFMLKFGVMPCVCLAGLGFLMGLTGANDHSGWPGVFLIALGVVFGGIAGLICLTAGPGRPAIQRRHKGGAQVSRLESPMETEGVPLGNVRLPEHLEPLHLLIEGATGTGKTQLLKQMVSYLRARGDTVVCVDSNYDMWSTFGQPDDLILSPFDPAFPGWLPKNEVRIPTDWSAMAQSFIGDGTGEAAQWHEMAKAMFAATARGYQRVVEEAGEEFNHTELFHLLTGADAEQLAPFIHGTSASSLGVNDKALGNVRMTFYETLKFWEHLRPGSFSVREWVEQSEDRPSIFIPYRKRQLPEAKNLISCWLDQIITTACDLGEDRENRVWIIVDELSGLGEIPSLKTAVTELRKTGFRVVAGIQNFEQVELLYGRNGAITITNSLSNKVILRATDAASAERQSKLIGDARYQVMSLGQSSGTDGKRSTTQSVKEEVVRVVLASEITALPTLQGFVKLAGEDTTYLTSIPVYQP